ncbi:MAG: response regulator [Pseudomonadota bacterium]
MMSGTAVPILLVDDRSENMIAMAALLDGLEGLEIIQASSGEQALEQLLQRDFGLVLMDVQMPRMDGFEAATRMRANPKTCQVPIIFVTAVMDGSNFAFRGYELGAVDYLVKPLDPVILQAKVQVFVSLYRQRLAMVEHERYMQHVERLVAERSGRRTAQDKQLRVLLVDDVAANLVALEALLAEMDDLLVVKVNSGSEALRAVLRDDYAVILLDVQMPGMDGFETAELIRSNPKTALMPIIFVTAGMKQQSSLAQGYQYGAYDYLIKPLDPTIVRSKVRVFCDLYRQRLELEKHSNYLEILVSDRTAELQRSTQELSESREGYRRLAETLEIATRAAGLGVWDWNVVDDKLVWDARMFELYGVSPQQFGGAYETWLACVHPDDRAYSEAAVQRALKNEQAYDIEFRIFLPDGRRRDIKADGQVLFDEHGQALRMTGVNYDITERKRIAEEVRRHRDHLLELVDERTASLNAIVEHAADGIVTINHEGEIISFNGAAETMFGYTAGSAIGHNVSMLMPEPDRSKHDGHLRHYHDTGVAHVIGIGRETMGQRQDGSVFPLYLAVSEIRVAGQRRFTGILRDISAQKSLEASLIQSRKVAEAANLAKSVFLANMSHELRTPLNAILGFSKILRHEANITPPQRKTLDLINRSGENLLSLINDVLDMSKIEAGSLQLECFAFDLSAMISDVLDLVRVRAEAKNLRLILDPLSEFPHFIAGDETKLRQCVINLIGNAIKFTEHGTVSLRLNASPGENQKTLNLVIEVLDSGVGISEADLQRVFEPFVQVGSQNTQKGTGLGLSITRRLVELMGGSLSVESNLGVGSCFRISVPVSRTTETSVNTHNINQARVIGLAPGQADYRILIVEDQMENWLLLQHLLESVGLNVRVAENGLAGIEEFKAWHPHFIWMDSRMPVMGGVEATKLIRTMQGGSDVKIVAVTASAFKEDRDRIMAAGMDDFICKPYREDEIFACLMRHLGLNFIREEEGDETEQGRCTLTREDFSALAPELKEQLQIAAVELDQEKMAEALKTLERQNPALARDVTKLANAFRFQELSELLDGDVAGKTTSE